MLNVTVITPTIGRPSLDVLVETMEGQSVAGTTMHLLIWDDVREAGSLAPESYNGPFRHSIVLPSGWGRNGNARASQLRAIGLVTARTPWVTFADDDCCWAEDHVAEMQSALRGRRWASTLRTLWAPSEERLGVDRFESVGEAGTPLTPDQSIDNNCLMFERPLGVGAAYLYRETVEDDDDRLMYEYLKRHAGARGFTNRPTVHQICSERRVEWFRARCSHE